MLARSLLDNPVGGAHYWSHKHDNFDICWGRVQISVLVSPIFLDVLTYWKSAIIDQISIASQCNLDAKSICVLPREILHTLRKYETK